MIVCQGLCTKIYNYFHHLDESNRSIKRNKFGGVKYVYDKDTMKELRTFFESAISRRLDASRIAERFPEAEILYWI